MKTRIYAVPAVKGSIKQRWVQNMIYYTQPSILYNNIHTVDAETSFFVDNKGIRHDFECVLLIGRAKSICTVMQK